MESSVQTRRVHRARLASDGATDRGDERVARHIATGETLIASDRSRQWWKANGRDGIRSFECVDCAEEGHPEPWLLYAAGDVQRPHLRHHRRRADGSEPIHGPETAWHLAAKRLLESWSRRQAAVLSANQEVSVKAGANGRRADVLVEGPGWKTALEAQHSYLDEVDRSQRHGDYVTAGVNPVWFYAPTNEPRLGADIPDFSCRNTFILDVGLREIGILIAAAKPLHGGWWQGEEDLLKYVDHLPTESERWTAAEFVPLDTCRIDEQGRFTVPLGALNLGDTVDLERERRHLRQRDHENRRQREAAIAAAKRQRRQATTDTSRPAAPLSPTCAICGYRLDPDVYRGLDRHLPEMRCWE